MKIYTIKAEDYALQFNGSGLVSCEEGIYELAEDIMDLYMNNPEPFVLNFILGDKSKKIQSEEILKNVGWTREEILHSGENSCSIECEQMFVEVFKPVFEELNSNLKDNLNKTQDSKKVKKVR